MSKTLGFPAQAVSLVSVLTLMLGCTQKPPGCAEPATVATIQKLISDNARQKTAANLDDPLKLVANYFAGLKISLTNVVSDGYNEQARKFSCKGHLQVNTVTRREISRDIVYSTQTTEDKNGVFLVEVQEFTPFIEAVDSDVYGGYYLPRRYRGEWKGLYSCSGIYEESSGPRGPFSMPVAMFVEEGLTGKLERTTKVGGVESLRATIGSNGNASLSGQGRNSIDDTWKTDFEGKIEGLRLRAKGIISTPEGRELRRCDLDLTLSPAS